MLIKEDPSILKNIKFTTDINNNEYILKMKEYAILNNVPIIKDEGLIFLLDIIKILKPKKILELGTAIGYSAINMALLDTEIYTIERDINMYNIAKENIKNMNLDDKIHCIFKDALDAFDDLKDNQFDLIFIDAAKAQYIKFFELYSPLLVNGGVIVSDNLLFHGLTLDNEDLSRSLKGLLRKINNYKEFLQNNKDFSSTLYDIGDGMSLSIKRLK